MSQLNDLADSIFDGVRLAGFKNRTYAFIFLLAAHSLLSSNVSATFYFFYRFLLWGWGLTDRVQIVLSQPCLADLF